jgi:hypothetical protein
MSSSGSDALTLEIPSRLAADRVTTVLVVACALVIEVVAARHPGGPVGLGVAVAILLTAWHRLRTRHAPAITVATVDGQGAWRLELSDGRSLAAVLLPGSRVLGTSVVLRWRAGSVVRGTWLTGWDLPPDRLRELTVRLLASGAQGGV